MLADLGGTRPPTQLPSQPPAVSGAGRGRGWRPGRMERHPREAVPGGTDFQLGTVNEFWRCLQRGHTGCHRAGHVTTLKMGHIMTRVFCHDFFERKKRQRPIGARSKLGF